MFHLLNFERKNKDCRRGKLVREDLSPILKESQAGNLNGKCSSGNNLKNVSNEDDSDTKDLVTQLNIVKIDSDDTDEYHTASSEKENEKKSSAVVHKSEYDSKSSKKTRAKPLQRGDTGISNRVRESEKPKIRKTRGPKKKKDSFIVSDNSSISNDSPTIYHRVLNKDIRADVRKITPRARLRRSVSTNDDGIFTPYIFGKRSSSEFSSSDEENEMSNIPAKLKLPKSQVPRPLFSNPKLKHETINLSDDSVSSTQQKNSDSKDESNNLFSTFESKKKNHAALTTAGSVPAFVSRNFLKDFSNIFTDDDSSNSDRKETTNNKKLNPVPNIEVIQHKELATPSDKKPSSKEKPRQSNERVSNTPTPITFRLKQVKNLTPKVDKPRKDEPLSFLESLSAFKSPHVLHPDAERYKKKFKKSKEELALKLFDIFNEQVFDNQLPTDLKIEWNARLRSSSGLCYNRRVKNVIGPNNECLRVSRIALSTKIIETPDRLRDTLIHEMCHAAAWIINNTCDGHGPRWKSWAAKAMKKFPELPLIRKCHDYSIKTKFKYRCIKCGYTIGRHSKSLNLERKRCGYCYGRFELILKQENAAKADISRTNMSPKNVKARPLSKFALFVKDNYGKIKSENPNLKHGEIMKELSKDFAFTKISN